MVENTFFDKLKTTYQGKKVFITGHTGFKGSWMLKVLTMLGADVMGYALAPNTKNDLFNIINGSILCNSIIADLRDKVKLRDSLINFQPDFVFHLAAQPLVRLSYQIPSETFEVNAIGSANLLDALSQLKNQCQVVMITTDKVYYNYEWEYPYRENDRLGGYDPYSASKACAELVIDSYRNSFFNIRDYDTHKKSIAVARAGNVIGGGDWSQDRLIPDIIKAIINNKSIIIRNPTSIRPWQHVMEPIIGYLMLGQKLKSSPKEFSQAYNFGPNVSDAATVQEIVQKAINILGKGNLVLQNNATQPHEASLLKLDISKVQDKLSWNPKLSSMETIEYTMRWYKLFIENHNMDNFTNEQIREYLLKIK